MLTTLYLGQHSPVPIITRVSSSERNIFLGCLAVSRQEKGFVQCWEKILHFWSPLEKLFLHGFGLRFCIVSKTGIKSSLECAEAKEAWDRTFPYGFQLLCVSDIPLR